VAVSGGRVLLVGMALMIACKRVDDRGSVSRADTILGFPRPGADSLRLGADTSAGFVPLLAIGDSADSVVPLFTLSRDGAATGTIDPVGILQGGGLHDFRRADTNATNQEQGIAFADRYLVPDRTYRALLHGRVVGTVTVRQRPPDDMLGEGCSSMGTSVTVQIDSPEVRLADSLAASNGKTALDSSLARQVMDLAKAAMREHGVTEQLVGRMQLEAAFTGDVRGAVGEILVATYQAVSPVDSSGSERQVVLFFIAEHVGSSYRITHSFFDDEDEVSVEVPGAVDVIDLDGDGTMELITESHYYESWDFAVFRKEGGGWKRVYKGAGGGC